MPPLALALVLVAAFLHAFWNLVVARADDTRAVTAVALALGVLVALPFAILRWDVRPEAWPYIVASSALELAYFWMLTRAYDRADLSLVYPIARGSAPVIVLIVSVALLGVATSAGQVIGVLLVAAGIFLIRGLRGTARASDVALALGVAVAIAAYTLVDRAGVRHADPVTYVTLIMIGPAILTMAIVGRSGGARIRRALTPLTAAAGVASVAAYGLVLVALLLAPPASVAATREVSVVIATAMGALVLGESVAASRWLGSVVVVVGVALLALA